MKDEPNLRGARAIATIEGKRYRGRVVTHIRNGRWLFESCHLPARYSREGHERMRRVTVDRSQLAVVE